MYSTCLFCHDKLGVNEAIEHFPVGRRLAYDASKGRLWVVCTHCGRWNLTPQEERWEALEECERHFSATRLRVSTENIGLARLAEGLELVRIGPALRTELAAWRYGRHFGHRRRRQVALTAGGVAVGGALLWAGPVAGLVASGIFSAGNWVFQAGAMYHQNLRTAMRLDDDGGQPVDVTLSHIRQAELLPSKFGKGWSLVVPHKGPNFSHSPNQWVAAALSRMAHRGEGPTLRLTGDAALRAAGRMLPKINRYAGSRRQVRAAVEMIETAGDPMQCFANAATADTNWWSRSYGSRLKPLAALPVAVRLALEMAAHEETEQNALQGELKLLEAAWREAEEIAAIADDLLLPDGVRRAMERLQAAWRPRPEQDR